MENIIRFKKLGGNLNDLWDIIKSYGMYRTAWEKGTDFKQEQNDYLKRIDALDEELRCLVRTICEEDIARIYKI